VKSSMRAADLLGRKYAQAGKPITDCPFDANGTPEQRAKALRFIQGYVSVKAGLTVNYDDA
jgi:hypothetical protein